MKKLLLISLGLLFVFGCLIYVSKVFQTSAENSAARWEYCAVTGTYTVSQTENSTLIGGAANICYLQNSGCTDETIKSEVIYQKFLQDFRLENTDNSKNAAYRRARDLAFSKAVAKLGAEGWEMISAPAFEFDDYVPNFQGNLIVSAGVKDDKPDVYFKRLKQ